MLGLMAQTFAPVVSNTFNDPTMNKNTNNITNTNIMTMKNVKVGNESTTSCVSAATSTLSSITI